MDTEKDLFSKEPNRERGFIELTTSDYLDDPLSLFLTVKGVRPAAYLSMFFQERQEYTRDDFNSDIGRAVRMLQDLGVPFREGVAGDYEYMEEMGIDGIYSFWVGKDMFSLNALLDAFESNDVRAIGRALGYPLTSVESFQTDEALDRIDYPPEIIDSSATAFIPWSFSRKNWRDELEEGRRHMEFIKRENPALYRTYFQENNEKQ